MGLWNPPQDWQPKRQFCLVCDIIGVLLHYLQLLLGLERLAVNRAGSCAPMARHGTFVRATSVDLADGWDSLWQDIWCRCVWRGCSTSPDCMGGQLLGAMGLNHINPFGKLDLARLLQEAGEGHCEMLLVKSPWPARQEWASCWIVMIWACPEIGTFLASKEFFPVDIFCFWDSSVVTTQIIHRTRISHLLVKLPNIWSPEYSKAPKSECSDFGIFGNCLVVKQFRF